MHSKSSPKPDKSISGLFRGLGRRRGGEQSRTMPAPTITASSISPETTNSANTNIITTGNAEPAQEPVATTGREWMALKAALKTLQSTVETFPRLLLAISALLSCLDTIETSARHRVDYDDLPSGLVTLVLELNQSLNEPQSFRMSGWAENIILSIEREANSVGVVDDGHRVGRVTGMIKVDDDDDKIHCYRRIEALFRILQVNVVLGPWTIANEQLVETLLNRTNPAGSPRYNSAFSTQARRRGCTENTRTEILANMSAWSLAPDAASIYWMHGTAGTGKTTIAYSFCEHLAVRRQLGASFFCARASPECRDVNRIVPTIAYQLAQYSYPFFSALCRVIEDSPDLDTYVDISAQFERLLRKPLLEVGETVFGDVVVVVVDALDECDEVNGTRLFLDMLFRYARDLPLKFFVTSRPEPEFIARLAQADFSGQSLLHLHDIEQSFVKADIVSYLQQALLSLVPPPTPLMIEHLAQRAGPQFIYAVTLVRYIVSTSNPITRLRTTLENTTERTGHEGYHVLDTLYSTILAAALEDPEIQDADKELMRHVLWTAVCALEPVNVGTISALIGPSDESRVRRALEPLQPVLYLSELSGIVSTYHASFPDFILDKSRSGRFFCNSAQHNQILSRSCFEVMKKQLRFNICNLESSFLRDTEVSNLNAHINDNISQPLSYGCMYWGKHLQRALAWEDFQATLISFLSHRLLDWMEVMNLKHQIRTGAAVMLEVEKGLRNNNASSNMMRLIADARTFVNNFATSPAVQSTPHIYISALAFCPKSSSVFTHYRERMRRLIQVRGTAIESKNTTLACISSSPVNSVAFSPDGLQITCGSADGVISSWDARSATLSRSINGHLTTINSVALSPDGSLVASASNDLTVRVWKTLDHTAETQTLKGHRAGVKSVAFSLDGTKIATGCSDHTICVWDVQRSTLDLGPLEGHTNAVNSVAFSPDSACIVSGSSDCTIRFWNAQDGRPLNCKEHTGGINSVSVSSDGARLVSGADDYAICVWDMRNGSLLKLVGPPQKHGGAINCVMFSPDGTRIVSGASNRIVCIWDARAGGLLTWLKGHTDQVNSVAFSPDGTRIVSGSNDYTARIWNVPTTSSSTSEAFESLGSVDSVVFTPDGDRIVSVSHSNIIHIWSASNGELITGPFEGGVGHRRAQQMAFSPDGARVVASARDFTIQVLDAYNGRLLVEPIRAHTEKINCVVFSPDNALIASGSDDHTIRVWYASNGAPIAEPFKGHADVVTSIAFSPDGKHIVSGSRDCTIRVWNVQTLNQTISAFTGPWTPQPDGWVVTSQDELLFWVPTDIRTSLPSPREKLVIGPGGSVSIDYHNPALGRVWHKCHGSC